MDFEITSILDSEKTLEALYILPTSKTFNFRNDTIAISRIYE